MKIMAMGGLFGNEGLCYMFREIIKQLAKDHTVKLDPDYVNQVDGYWSQFNNSFQGEEDIYLMNGHVTSLPEIAKKHKKIISITVFETDLPEDWVKSLNIPEVKQIWTISEFCKKLIIKAGVNKPVNVVYLGVGSKFFKNPINVFPKDRSFKFFNICAPHALGKVDRKGLDLLIRAFKEEFKDSQDVTLFLKINTLYADIYNRRAGKHFNLDNYIKSMIPKGMRPANICIYTKYLSPEQLNLLYNTMHCGVFPSRAEGFGLPQAEMASIGKPVITSDYGATNEFSDPRLRTRIMGLDPLDYDVYPYNQNLFAVIDVNHLRQLMRQVYDNWAIEQNLAEEHAKTLDKFNWDKTRIRINELLK